MKLQPYQTRLTPIMKVLQHKTMQPVYNSLKIGRNIRGLYDIITAPQQQVPKQH